MPRNWMCLSLLLAVALAAFRTKGTPPVEDFDGEGPRYMDHEGGKYFRERNMRRKHQEEEEEEEDDDEGLSAWELEAREVRRRYARKSSRWTNKDKKKGRRLFKDGNSRRWERNNKYGRRNARDNVQTMRRNRKKREGRFQTRRGRRNPTLERDRRRRQERFGAKRHRVNKNGANRHRRQKSKRSSGKTKKSRRETLESLFKKPHPSDNPKKGRVKRNRPTNVPKDERKKRKESDGNNREPGQNKKIKKPAKKKATGKARPLGDGRSEAGPKRKLQVKKMKIVLGKGGKKAKPKGSCKVSQVTPSEDGNSAIIYSQNLKKKGGCKMTFKTPKKTTITMKCPMFELHADGCEQEQIEILDRKSKESTKCCKTSGCKSFESSGNSVLITFKRQKFTGKCGRNFFCQISVKEKPETVQMLGTDKNCGKTFTLSKGQSAAIFSTNGPEKRECKIDVKGPKGTIFNITCPLIKMVGKGYCFESVRLQDEGAYGSEFACSSSKQKDDLSLTTMTHMASIKHERKKDEDKKFCSAGFLCIAKVVGKAETKWWQ